ncbi:PaaI family thioesterase [Streptomyces sp. NPDC052101]|uniref:PaaI family thioesterase n=1 Tax=Streptomyces sp. NPDC052101 TaxID=3155763 RepID=UPI003421FC9C
MAPQSTTTARSTTFRWQEPGPLFATRPELSGLHYLQGMLNGDVLPPPVIQALGITLVRAEPGLVRFAMPVRDHLVNHLGFLAGGILSTVVDVALASAVLSMVTPDQDIVTLDLNVDFLRPVDGACGSVTVDAEVVHLGRNRGLATCRAVGPNQRVYAIGKSTCLIRPKTPPADAPSGRATGIAHGESHDVS